jgi:hypothetical protein
LIRSKADGGESAEVLTFRGRRICLRQLQSEDQPLLETLVATTELHDLRMRFVGGFHTLPPYLDNLQTDRN